VSANASWTRFKHILLTVIYSVSNFRRSCCCRRWSRGD